MNAQKLSGKVSVVTGASTGIGATAAGCFQPQLAAVGGCIIHGDDDQIVPIDASAELSAKFVKNSVPKIYPGGTNSLGDTSKQQLNKDLLEFAKS
jgi:NAD(P)-dependent dehydrogenase (short-subunit alcohol dehydrogenase family)